MSVGKSLSQLFSLDDDAWLHHANPWSVYSRTLSLPLIAFSVWSRVWLDWYCLIPLVLSLLFTWLNPRLFPKPATTKTWASKAVFGERIWINHKDISIPAHHQQMPNILNLISALGLLLMFYGLWQLLLWPVLMGLFIQIIGKYWFLDRMVWLFEDKKDEPEYQRWIY